jgi:hypothetical protein
MMDWKTSVLLGIVLFVAIPFLVYFYSKIQSIAWFHALENMVEIRTHKKLEEWFNGEEKRYK